MGKTEIAIRAAERIRPPGEIISADSRTFYAGMDVGTAKPTPEERARVPHHLVDVTTPDRPWSLARFHEAAVEAIDATHARGHLPLLVGGSGQYVRALVEGWDVPRGEPDAALRSALEELARRQGAEALVAKLRAIDPVAAERVDPRNVRRVIRAIEVAQAAGPGASRPAKRGSPYSVLIIGLARPRDELYRRVDARVDAMMRAGLLEEVKRLVERGYAWELPAMSGVGYRQLGAYLRGELSLEAAVQEIRRATRRFIRHQANWFKPDDPNIHWLRVDDTTVTTVEDLIQSWLDRP